MADDYQPGSRRSSSKGKSRRSSSRGSKWSEDGHSSSEEDMLARSMSGSVFEEEEEDEDEGSGGSGFDVQTRIAQAMDDILEKSASVRSKGYSTLVSLLRSHVLTEYMSSRVETLTSILKSLKRDTEEQKAAGLLFSLLFLQVGPEDASAYFITSRDALTKIAKDPGRDEEARVHSITSLGMCCFVAGDEDEEDIMFFLESLFAPDAESPPSVMAAAIAAWTLLLTRIQRSLAKEKLDEMLPIFEDLLECSEDQEVAGASGEAVVLLAEMCECEPNHHLFRGAVSAIHALATESNKRKSRKNIKEQHSHFRNILATLEDGSVAAEKVTVRGETLTLNTWEDILTLGALRRVLQKGLDAHIAQNIFVREVFNLGMPRVQAKMTQEDKAAMRQRCIEEKKLRKVSRSSSRDAKASQQDVYS